MNAVSSASATDRFVGVTEIAGQEISVEQLQRTCHRYYWAARFCADKDVVEAGCGAGQGLGLLDAVAKTLLAGDLSPEVLARAKAIYGTAIRLEAFPADAIPVGEASVDVLLLFEALYYLPDFDAFLDEASRILRPGGTLLIVTANKDLYDFTPSPYSTAYLGVAELSDRLGRAGFDAAFWGYVDVRDVSVRQKLFRPLKWLASRLRLVPKTMKGKGLLKKVVFGQVTPMPSRIDGLPFDYQTPVPLPAGQRNRRHKVLYCAATKLPRE